MVSYFGQQKKRQYRAKKIVKNKWGSGKNMPPVKRLSCDREGK